MSPAREPKRPRAERVEVLTRVCADELLGAFGLSNALPPLRHLARLPAERLARQVATHDQIVGASGLAAGGGWALGRMARRAGIEGRENGPAEGPGPIAPDHPGPADPIR